MRPFVASLFLTVALAGCFGGDDGQDPDVADGVADVPMLPDGLEMDGATIVEYTDSAVIWRWADATGAGVAGLPEDVAVASTRFDVPAGVGLALEANLTWAHDGVSDLAVRIEDGGGEVVCSQGPLSYSAVASVQPAVACAGKAEPLDRAGRWSVVVQSSSSPTDGTPFTVELRMKAAAVALHEVVEVVPFEAVAADGVSLRGHVYLPEGDGPFGTVLELSGYWGTAVGNGASDGHLTESRGRTTMDRWFTPFADAGFAVALVSIRGTGASGGCQDDAGPQDVSDAGVVIETLAEQSWSTGHVGMIGHSWPAVSQYVAVASGAPALKAIVPSSGLVDAWSERTYHGAVRTDLPQATAYETFGLPRETLPPASRAGCPDDPQALAQDALLSADGDRSAYFEDRDHRAAVNGSQVAFFVDHGMANGEFLDLKDPELWQRIPHGNKTLWLGHWTHSGYPARADYFPALVAWFDHFLRDGPEPTTGIVEFQDTAGMWHRSTAWPPDGNATTLRLSEGALVAPADDVRSSEASFVSSNQRAIPDACQDKTLFVSPPLAEDVVLAGIFRANLTVASTLADGNFAANLWHVDEPWACGRAPGTQGISGVRYADPNRGLQIYEIGFALSDLRHRGHLEIGSDFPTDAPDVMRMTSESFATFVPTGERLVLAVGGGDPWLLDDSRKPVLTVHTGPEIEGELVLNVVEGDLTFDGGGGAESLVGGVVG